jgi:MFS family permease
VKETYIVGEEIEVIHKEELEEKGNIFQLFYNRPYLALFFLLQIVYSFTYAQHKFAFPITLNEIFVNQGAKMLGYMASINAITVLLVTAYMSAVTKKNHQLTNMTFAGLFYAIGFGMLGFVNNVGLLIISTILWTLGEILHSINAGVYIANNSPSNYRARLNAVYEIGSSIGISLSTIFSSFYIEHFGSKSIWTVVFIVGLVASLFMFVLKQVSTRESESLVGIKSE